MKASELMLGDFLRYKQNFPFTQLQGKVVKVCGLDGRVDVRTIDDGKFHESEHPDWLEPIPLTQEILEKNFRGCKRGSGSLTYFVYELNEEYFIRASARSVDFCTHYDDSEHAAHDDIYLVELKYVHTLQHVLPLYGIDKEITI